MILISGFSLLLRPLFALALQLFLFFLLPFKFFLPLDEIEIWLCQWSPPVKRECADSATDLLLVTKCVDGIETGCFSGRIETEEYTHGS